MKPNDIILNKKAIKFLQDKSRFILNTGPTGTGKTFLSGFKTFLRVFNSPREHTMFAIIAESISTAEKMFIDDESSFVNIYHKDNGGVCDYKGGSKPHIIMDTPTGVKRIYLGGYGTARDYKRVLGLNLTGIHIEEISIAHDDFIREAFVRATRKGGGWIHATTNGGIPEQKFYVDYWDKSFYNKKYNETMPFEEMKYLQQSDKDFSYWYWGFKDSATQTEDDVKRLYSIFPEGSFYYNSKVLGIRGYVEGMLYARILNDIYITKHNQAGNNIHLQDINLLMIKEIIIGVDIGSGGGDSSAARTSAVMVGFTKDYQRAVILDRWRINGEFDYNDIVKGFWEWIAPYYSIFRGRISEIRVDSADPLFIRTLRNNNPYGIMIMGSIKDTIALRVRLKQQLIFQYRLLFSDLKGAQELKVNLSKIKSDGKDGQIDDGMEWIDDSDALDYALTPRKNSMMGVKWNK